MLPISRLMDGMWLQAAKEEQARLQEEKVLGPDVEVGLLHGRMAAAEKAEALLAFAEGRAPVLISTSVVEVLAGLPSPHSYICGPDGQTRSTAAAC